MNTEHFESLARLAPALRDTDCDFSARGGHGAVRAEAVRQVRWLQRALARTLSTHTPGASGLTVPTARAGRTDDPDVLRQAGEDVPSWVDLGGSLVGTVAAARGTASVRPADLLADRTRVRP
jgi:hypothetical protein